MGRPREFDAEKALDQALALFWAKGYEGTSVMDLVDAIGIKKPSLYAAFGSKEELFFKALDRYTARLGAAAAPSLSLPSAREGVEAHLRALATFLSTPGQPKGCLLVQGALACSEESRRASEVLNQYRQHGVRMIGECLERAKEQQELPANADIDALARYFGAVSHGISVQAASGISTEDLHQTISIAMNVWPPISTTKKARSGK